MLRKKHKRAKNHVIIVTSDAVDANVKQFRIKPWVLQVIILLLCIVIGVLIGYLHYEEKIWAAMSQKNLTLQETLQETTEELAVVKNTLEQEQKQAEAQITELNEKVLILSNTVNQKVESEKALIAQLEGLSLPTEFPLTGSASMEIVEEEKPMCIFTASIGTTVVATAGGTVTAVNDDEEYGHNIWVDHGNGYVTIYKNKGDVTVKPGDSVVQGSTLYIVGDEEEIKLAYQMQKDGVYINPTDMLAISG